MDNEQQIKAKTPSLMEGVRNGRKNTSADSAKAILLGLIHGDALGSGLFFSFGLFCGHGLIDPLIGRFQIRCPGCGIVAFNVRLLPIHQIHVGHGVVIVGSQLERFVESIEALLDNGHVLLR